jgi:hypothetical protein
VNCSYIAARDGGGPVNGCSSCNGKLMLVGGEIITPTDENDRNDGDDDNNESIHSNLLCFIVKNEPCDDSYNNCADNDSGYNGWRGTGSVSLLGHYNTSGNGTASGDMLGWNGNGLAGENDG